MIYLDNAATSLPKPPGVIRAVTQAMNTLGNCGRGVHGGSLPAARAVFGARQKLADFFGFSHPERVCFTANATEALNTAIRGLLRPGDHVIATDLEHNSVLRPLYDMEKRGVSVSFLRADQRGCVDIEQLPSLIRKNTRCIVCTHASNLTGNVLDIRRVGQIAAARGLLFILDAAQTAGSLPIHMEKDHISVLCFTGHKGLMGPQGTGGLCVSPGITIAPLKSGGTGTMTWLPTQPEDYPTCLEAGTLNSHGIAGLAAGVDYIQSVGIGAIHEKELKLMGRFYQSVREIPGVTVYGDFSGDRAPVVALNIKGMDAADVSELLYGDYDIAVRSGGHCAPRMHDALGTRETGAVRFSFGWFNTQEETDAAAAAVAAIAAGDAPSQRA